MSAAGWDAVLRACEARDISRCGVPALLALDDKTAPGRTFSPRPGDAAFAQAFAARAAGFTARYSRAGGNTRYSPFKLGVAAAAESCFGETETSLEPDGALWPEGAEAARCRELWEQGAYIRVLNYHSALRCDAARLEAQLAALAQRYTAVTLEDLDCFFETGRWHKERPGLIPAVFEGFRDGFDVLAPLLERYGFTGWFYIPSDFLCVPVPGQEAYGETHGLSSAWPGQYPDGRQAMTWGELAQLSRRHEVCCHSASHLPLDRELDESALRAEIVGSKARLEEQLQKPVRVFCARRGKAYGEIPAQKEMLDAAGYTYITGDLAIEKIG